MHFLQDAVYSFLLGIGMKENMSTMPVMVLEDITGRMVGSTKVTIPKIYGMVKVSLRIQLVRCILEASRTVNALDSGASCSLALKATTKTKNTTTNFTEKGNWCRWTRFRGAAG